jgi:hypothetical protein
MSAAMLLFFIIISGVGLSPLGTAATSGLLYKPQMIDEGDFWSNWWNENLQGKPKYSEKVKNLFQHMAAECKNMTATRK